MNKDQFATLVEGDTFMVTTMPKQTFKVARIQTEFDYTQSPPTKRTWAIDTEDGRYLKNFDKEVEYAHLIPKAGDLIKVLVSNDPHIPANSLLLIHGELGQPVKHFKATLSDRAIITASKRITGPSNFHTERFLFSTHITPTYTRETLPLYEGNRFLFNSDIRLFELDELPPKA